MIETIRQFLETLGRPGQFWVNYTGAPHRMGPFDRKAQAITVARGIADQKPRERISVERHNWSLDEDQICYSIEVGGG